MHRNRTTLTWDSAAVNIMIVDDDTVDRMAVKRAFQKLKIDNAIYEASDGLDGLEKLRGIQGKHKTPRPYLILLDLNMPRMNGIEFLVEIRKDDTLQSDIVFVLTTSRADEDRVAAYRYNVAGYIVKSKFGEEFWRVVRMIEHYWHVVEFP